MAVLQWNVSAEKFYELGVDKCVLYVRDAAGLYPLGVAWEGVTNATQKPGGDEPTDLFANNVKYTSMQSSPTFEFTLEALQYPSEFLPCDGLKLKVAGVYVAQQARSSFGFVYRTFVGNDAEGSKADYKLHLVYGCTAKPSELPYATIGESPEAMTFSWDITTVPVTATGFEPLSRLVIDSRDVDPADLTIIENTLFGTVSAEPSLPLPDALFALLV